MTNEQFQRLQQGTEVRTRDLSGRVYQPRYDKGKVEITVRRPLRRMGQRASVKYQNVELVEVTGL